MKKTLLSILSLLILVSATGVAYSKQNTEDKLSEAIKLYKAGNYTLCYENLNNYVKENPANALAYYYLAMTSVQIGKRGEAIDNYNKTLALTPEKSKLARYATKGKICVETPDKCKQASLFNSAEEQFILNKFAPNVSEEVKGNFERLKIENIMREMNRKNDIDPQKFKEYTDFSTMNLEETPSNDEIVAALKTLQKAGLGGFVNDNSNYADLSVLTGESNTPDSLYGLMGTSGLNPRLIQTMLTNNMSLGF